ncbi:hypothetical protein LshimejAT787_0109140 [Lyophyllum shimeji]|uniref:Transmembrane protein n=1 Tax=Lyophyllum shimeji TaxID=47721 RepID=A0A9P3UK26_LYOSH|nr:hypothetical protein LshimejAT787_0109140 [Lyophyllum shimeji]
MPPSCRPWIFAILLSFIVAAHAASSTTSTGSETHVPLTMPTEIHKPPIPPHVHRPSIFIPKPPTATLQDFSTELAPFGTETRVPRPTRTRGPDFGNHSPSHQSPIVIFFEALCGLVGVFIFLVLLRFCYSYRKTPEQDRVSAFIDRHRLQREMEELQRRPPIRRFSIQEPAPPYMPRPPSYAEVALPTVEYVGIMLLGMTGLSTQVVLPI